MSHTRYQKQYQGRPEELGHVAVLYGGLSSERPVSLDSGRSILDALQRQGVHATGIDVNDNVVTQLCEHRFDYAFIALHGPGGEDGKIQAVLECLHIPYTGSDYSASSLAMNKVHSKKIWQASGLPTPAYASLTASSDWQALLARLGPEVFVKPSHEGSSIGMSCAATVEELKAAYRAAANYDAEVLVEQKINGPEYTVAVLNGHVLPAIGLQTDHRFYDYDAKYIASDTRFFCPCDLSAEDEANLAALVLDAFNLLGCRGWGRIDVMRDSHSGQFYLLEANTVPGMTSHSLVPKAALVAGLSFDELVLEILAPLLP